MLLLLLGVLLIFLGLMVLLWPRDDEKYLKEKIEENGQNEGNKRTQSIESDFANFAEEEESGNGKQATSIKGGGVIMIGPIPVVLGSDPKTALFMMIMALAVMVLWLLGGKAT